ncbi:MAG: hypothetical protein V3V12_06350 [Gammaproteobacteria bacterium]
MSSSTVLRRTGGALLALILSMANFVFAESDHHLPFSELKIAEPVTHFSDTQACVEPEDEMRRNHMEYILHQRDETVHDGIRTRQYALEECINCHATKDTTTGEFIRVEDDRHFCASCHIYAAVKIDCFQCHADVPVRASIQDKLQSGMNPHDKMNNEKNLSADTLELLTSKGKFNE